MKYLLIIILLLITDANTSIAKPRPPLADAPLSRGSENFVVHYKDIDQLYKIDLILAAAEYSLERQTTEFGWPQPANDGILGGDERYDIYLLTFGLGYKGFNRKDDEGGSTFMEIDRNLSDDDFKITVAHELNHGLQYVYYNDYDADAWFFENVATYMAELTYDFTIRLYNEYMLKKNPIENPELSIRHIEESYHYNGFLWPRFLSMWLNDVKISQKIFKSIHDNLSNKDVIANTEIVLLSYDSNKTFQNALRTYGEWLFLNKWGHFNDQSLPTYNNQINLPINTTKFNNVGIEYSRIYYAINTSAGYININIAEDSKVKYNALIQVGDEEYTNIALENVNNELFLPRGCAYIYSTTFPGATGTTSISYDKLPYKNIIFTNKYNNANIGGEFILNGNGIINETILSGNSIKLTEGNNYMVKTSLERKTINSELVKHNNWNNLFGRHKQNNNLTVTTNTSTETCQFLNLNYAKLQNRYLDNLNIPQAQNKVNFLDPWYVDELGNQPETFFANPVNSPYEPNGKFGAVEKGVFLNMGGNDYKYPCYSIKSENIPTVFIPSTNKTHKLYFQGWKTSSGNARIENRNLLTSKIEFLQANTVVNADYKANQLSGSADAFMGNGQRKVINVGAGLLAVYESNNNIYLEVSTDNGVNWEISNNGLPLNTLPAKNPTIDFFRIVTNIKNAEYIIAFEELIQENSPESRICVMDNINGRMMTGYINPQVSSLTQPVIAAMTNYKFVCAYTENYEGNTTVGYTPGASGSTLILGSSYFINENDVSTLNPTIAANKTNYNTFQIAYQYNNNSNGSSAIRYSTIAVNNLLPTLATPVTISTGSGYTGNTNPSIIAMPEGVNGNARVVWTGYRERPIEEELSKVQTITEYNVVFKDPGYYRFWTFGANVNGANINKTDLNTAYVFAWSENDGMFTNKYADNSLSTIRTLTTKGKDVQVSNAASKTSMKTVAFQSQTIPYSFSNVTIMAKENNNDMYAASEGVLFRDGSKTELYYHLGNIEVNDKKVSFVKIPDTLDIKTLEVLNENMITEPIAVNDNSNLVFNIKQDIINKEDIAKFFKNNEESISLNIEIVDDVTNEVLGLINNKIIDKNTEDYSKDSYLKLNTEGLGERTVRLKVKISSNFDINCTMVNKLSDEQVFNKNIVPKEIKLKDNNVIVDYALIQNYPNPFNPSTTITFTMPEAGYAKIKIFNTLGEEIKVLLDEHKQAGIHNVTFDARDLPSGVYVYQLNVNEKSFSKKMVLMK